MARKTERGSLPEPQVPSGYGKLVSVTPFGSREVLLWFEDSGGNVRVIRMGCGRPEGLALEILGQGRIART